MCSYIFDVNSGSDSESGIPAGISGDKFSRTEQPEFRKIQYSGAGYPAVRISGSTLIKTCGIKEMGKDEKIKKGEK